MSTSYHPTTAGRVHVLEAGGGAAESMGGVAVVILAILALVGIVPRILAPVAGIIFGAAFIVEGAAIAAKRAAAVGAAPDTDTEATVEALVGLATAVLGLLALIGIGTTPAMMGALVITGGAGLLMSVGVVSRVTLASEIDRPLATSSATAAHLLAGGAAIVLGILALTNAGASAVLTTVGLLVLGCSLMLSGTALSSAMLRLFQPRG